VTVQTCVRCGQLLLPELVRELGDGRRCPFCNAALKVEAQADTRRDTKPDVKKAASSPAPQSTRLMGGGPSPARAPHALPRVPAAASLAQAQVEVAMPPQPPARRPPPAAPSARAAVPPAAPTLPGLSAPRSQAAAAAAVVSAPPPAEPDPASPPALALVRTPEADTAPNPLRVPEPLPALAPSSPPWLAPLRRRRPWLAGAVVLAVLVTIGLVLGHRPSATREESPAAAPKGVARPAAPLASAPPSPPDPSKRIAASDRPVAPKDGASSRGGSPGATGHAKGGSRAHTAQRIHRQKRHTPRPGRSKHARVVALASAAAPKVAGDDRAARDSYERGNQRLLTGDTAGAISAYEQAVRSAPASPSGYRGLGLAYEKAGKVAEAVRAFRHYLKLAPSSGDRELVARRLRHLLRPGADSKK
jgi:hypothetical protein